MLRQLLPFALLATLTSAHFELLYPQTIGFDESTEGAGPCGGFNPDFSKPVPDFHAGGDAIALTLGHSQGTWLFRATLDQTAGGNWTQIFPITFQDGLGRYCAPTVTVPESFVGKKGVVSTVCNAPDGFLYQCAAVNFVSGTGTQPSQCTNGSSVTLSFTSDASLSALVGNGTSAPVPSPTTSTAPSQTPNAASSLQRFSAGSWVGSLMGSGLLVTLGAMLVF